MSEEKTTRTTTPTTTPTSGMPARMPPRMPVPPAGNSGVGAAGAKPQAVAPVAPRHHGPARLSITALIGAIWAPLFFIMLLLSSVQLQTQTSWQRPLQLIIVPLGWAAPFATTVLGLLALGNIQRSHGGQYGLSLALFDALLFPLGLIDFLVFWLCWTLASSMGTADMMGTATSNLIFHQAIPTVLCVLGDYYLVTRAWAAVQPTAPAAPPHR